MKPLIKYSVELDILSLCTFKGYKGGDIIKYVLQDIDTAYLIRNYCTLLGINVNIKTGDDIVVFCEFGEDIYDVDDEDDTGVYELKI